MAMMNGSVYTNLLLASCQFPMVQEPSHHPILGNEPKNEPEQESSQPQLHDGNALPVPRLYTVSEIKELLEEKLCTEVTYSEAETFAHQTGCLPIVLQLVVLHMKHQRMKGYNYTVSTFNNEFKNEDITSTLNKLSWYSSELLGCTMSLLDAWKYPIMNVESHPMYGNIAMNVLNTLAYTTGKEVPLELVQSIQNINPNDIQNAVKLLQANQLVTQNHTDINVNPLLVRILKTNISNEFFVLLDLLYAYKKCCIYENQVINHQIFPSINFSIHLIEAWEFVSYYNDLVHRFSDLPLILCQNEYHYTKSIHIMEIFMKNYVTNFESVVGFNNENLLKLYEFYISKLNDDFEISKLCLHVLGSTTSKCEITLSFRTHLAKSIIANNQYSESYRMLKDIYENQKMCVPPIDQRKLIHTLHVMFTAVCSLEETDIEKPFTNWCNLIKDLIKDPIIDQKNVLSLVTLIIDTNEYKLIQNSSMKLSFLQLFNELFAQICVTESKKHPLALKILFQKADVLYKFEMYAECVTVYLKIIEMQVHLNDYDEQFNTVIKMVKSCIKCYYVEPNRYKLCEQMILNRMNKSNVDHKLTRIAIYTVEKYAHKILPAHFILKLYDTFIDKLIENYSTSNTLTLKVMLDRCSFLHNINYHDAAWEDYYKVCVYKNVKPIYTYTNFNSLIAQLKQKL